MQLSYIGSLIIKERFMHGEKFACMYAGGSLNMHQINDCFIAYGYIKSC